MDVAALVISILALLVAALSAWFTKRQADASERQVIEAKRANDRVDDDRAAARQQAEAEAERNRFRWVLTREPSQNMYRLQNGGTEDAHDVVITVNVGAFISGGRAVDELLVDAISSQGAIQLALGGPLGDFGPRELSIRWRGHEHPAVVLSVSQ